MNSQSSTSGLRRKTKQHSSNRLKKSMIRGKKFHHPTLLHMLDKNRKFPLGNRVPNIIGSSKCIELVFSLVVKVLVCYNDYRCHFVRPMRIIHVMNDSLCHTGAKKYHTTVPIRLCHAIQQAIVQKCFPFFCVVVVDHQVENVVHQYE